MPKNTEVGRTKHCAALVEVCACGMCPLCCLPAPGALGRGLPLLHVKGEGPWGGGKGWTAAPGSHLTSLPQLAEVHGVPRGLYDGPVHDVVLSTKAVPTIAASRIAGCASKVPAVPVRNLHQSGFSLSGRWGQDSMRMCSFVLLQGWVTQLCSQEGALMLPHCAASSPPPHLPSFRTKPFPFLWLSDHATFRSSLKY